MDGAQCSCKSEWRTFGVTFSENIDEIFHKMAGPKFRNAD